MGQVPLGTAYGIQVWGILFLIQVKEKGPVFSGPRFYS
jgi:hypothetical protein